MVEMFLTGHSYFVQEKKIKKVFTGSKVWQNWRAFDTFAKPPAINRYASWQDFSCAPRVKKNVKFGLFILRLILSLKTFSSE